MPDTIVPNRAEGTPTIYRAGRRAFMPDTIVPVGGHSCPIQSCLIVPKGTPTGHSSCLKALLPTQ